jgi:hypothetical protein
VRTLLRAAGRAVSGGRFVTRWTFVTVFAVSLTVLAPLPAAMSVGERAIVASVTALVFSGAWIAVALLERSIAHPRVRASLVAGTLVVAAVLRPSLQDAVSLAGGMPVPPAGDIPLRAATNLAVSAVALIGTAALVDIVRAIRETNSLLTRVLAQWDGSAERVRRYVADARADVRAVAQSLRTAPMETVADVRSLAADLRAHAHVLADRAAGPPAPEDAVVVPLASVSARRPTLRLPPVGATAVLYGLSVLPYALRSVGPIEIVEGLLTVVLVGAGADLVARSSALRRSPRARAVVFAAATVLAGAVLATVAWAQAVPFPLCVVPLAAYPVLAQALAAGRGALHALRVERRRLSTAIADRGRADDLGTRRTRAGLQRAADLVHGDAQGATVLFALRHPDATPTQLAELRAELAAVADEIQRVLDAPVPASDSPTLAPLLRAWGSAMPVEAHVTAAASTVLRNDRALAGDVSEIVSEGLLNAAKHARVRAARVEVRRVATAAGPRLRVRVASTGVPAARARLRPGSRAERLGARLLTAGDDTVLEALFAIAGTDRPSRAVVSTEHSGGALHGRA